MADNTAGNKKTRGRIPTGQTSRGTSNTEAGNPKNNQSRRGDVIGRVPGDGDAVLVDRNSRYSTSTNYGGQDAAARYPKGSPASIPDPSTVNRGYSIINDNTVPAVRTNTGANRQNFGIDPGDVPQPDGDTTDSPRKPSYGVGTTGE